MEAPGGEKWEHLKSRGKQWQATPKNLPRMQRTRAIPVAWLNSGLCPDRSKGWIPIIIIIVMLSNCVALCSWCHRNNLWPRWHHHTHWSDWRGLVAGTWSGWNIRSLSRQLRGTSQLGSRLQKTLKGFICLYSISFITVKCLCILQHWFIICILITVHNIFNLSLFWNKYV